MKNFKQIGTEVGELVERKNIAYGDSVPKAAQILGFLYPNGVQPNQYVTFLLLGRIAEKMARAATDNDSFGESSFLDIGGYGVVGVSYDEQRKAQARCNSGNVRIPAVTTRSRKTGASVLSSAVKSSTAVRKTSSAKQSKPAASAAQPAAIKRSPKR